MRNQHAQAIDREPCFLLALCRETHAKDGIGDRRTDALDDACEDVDAALDR
jgi:hypothetical protein